MSESKAAVKRQHGQMTYEAEPPESRVLRYINRGDDLIL